MTARTQRYFLLSPANCSGRRAQLMTRPEADFELARRLRRGDATIGEAFAFMSSLYFRGKLTYAEHFASPRRGTSGVLVIAPGRGLLDAATKISLDDLRSLAEVPVALEEPRYRAPFERDAISLAERVPNAEIVLLGSVATTKYVEVLSSAFGRRLLFPREFLGRGDMSRGGLLLRSVRSDTELAYAVVADEIKQAAKPKGARRRS